jgi:N-glycosylase/DNA lyase
MKTTLQIQPEGPFNLDLTIKSGQTSQPPWKFKSDRFWELIKVDGKLCLVGVHQKPGDLNGPIMVEAESKGPVKKDVLRSKLLEIFSLEDDLSELYKFLESDEKLKPTVDFCRGLRIFKAHDPFECIISSICSANNSILRWSRSIRKIKENWGENFDFKGETFHTFPSPEVLMKVPEHDEEMEPCQGQTYSLKSCGVGYRCSYMKKAARMIHEEINITTLGEMNYHDAFKTVLSIPGVGPKVADCILLYGYGIGRAFPVDVWIGRILSHLYFEGEDLKPRKVRNFGMEHFGEHAGYVQLYLFHYARKSGLLKTLKPKK